MEAQQRYAAAADRAVPDPAAGNLDVTRILVHAPSLWLTGRGYAAMPPVPGACGPAQSAGDLIQETEHAADPPVRGDHGDIGADHLRFGALGAEVPAEASLLVMRIDRPGQREHPAGELRLGGADGGVDRVVAADLRQRVAVLGFLGPDLADELATLGLVGQVPAIEVAVNHVVHGFSFRCDLLMPPIV